MLSIEMLSFIFLNVVCNFGLYILYIVDGFPVPYGYWFVFTYKNMIEQYCFNLVVLVFLSVIIAALRVCLVGKVEKWKDKKWWKAGKVREWKKF